MDKFVSFNGRILDYGEYRKDFSMMEKIVRLDLKEYFGKLGFGMTAVAAKNNRQKPLPQKLKFYNGQLDMQITVIIGKRHKPEFV